MKTLVVIPARSGSKGLLNKNIMNLTGKPLIHYSIEVAQKVFPNEDICFSTDSKDYKRIAEETGIKVPFLRPKYLSTDSATSQDVLIHALEYYSNNVSLYDNVLLLQPTSPFRKRSHLVDIMKLYENTLDMLVSVRKTESNPYYVLAEENADGFLEKSKKSKFTRRQDCPTVYEYNGSMYLINVNSLRKKSMSEFTKVIKYEMDKLYSIDIDDQMDFDFATFLIQNNLVY